MAINFVMNYENKFEEVRVRFINCADFNDKFRTIVFFKGKKVVGKKRSQIIRKVKRGNFVLFEGNCCDWVGLPDDYFKNMYNEALKNLREGGDK